MRTWLVKCAVIANAILAVVAFVGCPCRKNSGIVPPVIAPPRDNFIPQPISTPRERFMPPTIAIPPPDFQDRQPVVVPAQPSQNTKDAPQKP
jgi:hypothetical protein